MSFSTGFKAAANKVESDINQVVATVEKKILYSADTAVSNMKSEATKLESLVESKLASIVAHNKNILNLQNIVKDLESDVAKAKALKDKITAVVS